MLFSSPARAFLLDGIAAYAHEAANWELLFLSGLTIASSSDPIPALRRKRMDGLITDADAERLHALSRINKPLVSLNVDSPLGVAPSVLIDEQAVGRMAARFLLDSGARSFAFCGLTAPWSREREKGFAVALRAQGHDYESIHAPGANHAESGAELVGTELLGARLQALDRPVSLMACSDDVAAHVIETALDLGLRIPSEVAVIGVDNTAEICEMLPIPLSSVDLNPWGRGYAAAQLLDRLMQGERAPRRPLRVPPRRVVPRRSTEVVVGGHPRLGAALSHIREHACDGIDVGDVAQVIGVSRAKLHRLFQERLGRSPGEEIRRVRFRHAERFLASTDLSLADIAARCGFSSASYLSNAFRHSYGMSPGAYRTKRQKHSG
jgi:LacI family transcriptional regulator